LLVAFFEVLKRHFLDARWKKLATQFFCRRLCQVEGNTEFVMNTSKATVELVVDKKSFQWCYIEVERIVKNKS
ncbi:unnamed protein product, partial [Porites evermanni]